MSRPDYETWPDNGWKDIDTYPVSYVKALEGYVDFLEGILEDRDPLLLW